VGVLSAKRGSPAPAIGPGCTLLVHPIFEEMAPGDDGMIPSATLGQLAAAIFRCIERCARMLNLNVAFAQPSFRGERPLEEALNHAARRGVI
jgi:hypothetical protein